MDATDAHENPQPIHKMATATNIIEAPSPPLVRKTKNGIFSAIGCVVKGAFKGMGRQSAR